MTQEEVMEFEAIETAFRRVQELPDYIEWETRSLREGRFEQLHHEGAQVEAPHDIGIIREYFGKTRRGRYQPPNEILLQMSLKVKDFEGMQHASLTSAQSSRLELLDDTPTYRSMAVISEAASISSLDGDLPAAGYTLTPKLSPTPPSYAS